MKFELTEYQKKALNFDEHISLTANAGSGKTFVLSERYILIALQRNTPLSKIVAITFTDKAAGELRSKIAERLIEKINDCADDSELKKLYEIRRQLVSANISTIHSFCTNLLREFAADASIDVNFLLADQQAADELLDISIEEFLKASIAKTDSSALKNLLRMFRSGERFAEIIKKLLHRRDTLSRLSEIYENDENQIAEYLERRYSELLDSIFPDELRPIIESVKTINSVVLEHYPDCELALETAGVIAEIVSKDKKWEKLKLLFDLLERITSNKKIRTRKYAEKKVRSAIADEIQFAENFKHEFSALSFNSSEENCFLAPAKLGKSIFETAANVLKIYESKKSRESLLDFEDLMLKTKEILARPEVRNYLGDRFDYFMIDEYQDTNQTQYEIFLPLLDDLKKGNLFVVGDEKQSIYRFRNADLEVFRKTREKIKEGEKSGLELPLPHTFRLAPNNTLFTNRLSSVWFNSPNPLFNEVGDSPMKFASQTTHPGTVEILLNKSGEVKHEAVMAATRIKNLRITDNIDFGEIAVLCRKRSDFADLEEAFIDAEIPYEIIGGRGFYNQQLVYDISNYLSFLLNQENDSALLGILRAPFFMLSDDAIYKISLISGKSFFEKICSYSEKDNQSSEIVRKLKEHINRFQNYPLPNLIESILSETHYYLVINQRRNSQTILANAEKLISIASNFMQRNFAAPGDFIDFLETSMTKSDDESQAAPDTGSDAVKLMTIHQSKGLEFRTVLLFHCSTKVKKSGVSSSSVELDKEFGVIAKVPGKDYFADYETPPAVGMFNYLESKRSLAESKRLLYVAVTRAKEYLFISASAEKDSLPSESFIDFIYQGLGASVDDNEISVRGTLDFLHQENGQPVFTPREISMSIPVLSEVEEISNEEEASPDDSSSSTAEIYLNKIPDSEKNEFISATKIAVFLQCPLKYKLIYELGFGKLQKKISGFSEPDNFNLKEDEESAGKADVRGTIIHRLLEMELELENLESGVKKELSNYAELNSGEKAALESEIISLLKKFFNTNIYKELKNCSNYKNEYEIYRFVQDFYLYGIIDKLILQEDKCIIVDYKTDKLKTEMLARKVEHYKNQLLFYAFCVQKIYPAKRLELRLVFLDLPDESVVITVSGDELTHFEETLHFSINNIRNGIFPANLNHCSSCHFSDRNNKCVHPKLTQ